MAAASAALCFGIGVATFGAGDEAVPHVAEAQILGLLDLCGQVRQDRRRPAGRFVVAQLEPGVELALEPLEAGSRGHRSSRPGPGSRSPPRSVGRCRRARPWPSSGIGGPRPGSRGHRVDAPCHRVVGELVGVRPGAGRSGPTGPAGRAPGPGAAVVCGGSRTSADSSSARAFPFGSEPAGAPRRIRGRPRRAGRLGRSVRAIVERIEEPAVGLAGAPGFHACLADGHQKLTALDHIAWPGSSSTSSRARLRWSTAAS